MNAIALALLALASDAGLSKLDEAPLSQLEREYGANVLVPDPRPYRPPVGADLDAALHRHYGAQPGLLNGILNTDANLVDSLLAHCAVDLGIRHRDDPSKWAPAIGEYVSVSKDGLVVTVRLKKGIRWQFPAVEEDEPAFEWLRDLYRDGAPEVTASDFRFTLDMIQHPDVGCRYLSYYENASIRLLGRYTFQVVWGEYYAYGLDMVIGFPQVLARFLYTRDELGNPIPEAEQGAALKDHWYNQRICGYGPYAFVRMVPNEVIVLRRMDGFEPVRPAFREIHWHITQGLRPAVQRMVEGQIDFLVFLPDLLREWVTEAGPDSPFNDGTFKTEKYDRLEYLYLGWNCRKPPFDDRRVRRAMSMAFNREAFLKNQWGGLGRLVDSHVFAEHPHFNPEIEGIRFDLDAASRLLDEIGYGDEDGDGVRDRLVDGNKVDLSFTIKCFSPGESAEMFSVMEIYREDLRSIGVDAKLLPLPFPELHAAMKRFDFDAYTGLWSLGWSVDPRNQFHSHSVRNGGNYVGFKNQEFDELSERYVRDPGLDDAGRKAIAWRMQEILHEEQPYTFFMRRQRVVAFAPWLKGIEIPLVRPQLRSFGWYRLKDE